MILSRLLVVVALLACVCSGGAALSQNSVTLRHHARVPPGEPVLLGALALVEGPDAAAISAVVISENVSELLGGRNWHEFKTEAIRESLDAADQDAAWGLVRVRGSGCHLGEVLRDRTPKPRSEGNPEDASDALPSGARVRDAILRKLARVLSVDPQDLRVTFRETDDATLNRLIMGRSVTVVPLGMSQSMPVRVRVYERNGSLSESTVRASIEIRRRIVRLNRPVARGQVVLPEDLVEDVAWVAPDVAPTTASFATGSLARRKLDAGTVLTDRDLERPILIGRGELVRVHCISGSLVVESEARALEDGREGETIELEPTLGGGRFRATVRGRGRAAVLVSEPVRSVEDLPGARIGSVRILNK